jgi:hypothetical protein
MEKKLLNNIRLASASLVLATFISMILAPGCSKDKGVCVTNTGAIIFQERSLGDFDSISLNDNVNLILRSDLGNSVQVEAGRNIIQGITTEVVDRQLIINNKNTCNWLRSYDSPINVHISSSALWKISYNSSGDIWTAGKLQLDSINVELWGGCGTIDLAFDSLMKGNFSLNMGTGNIILRGKCGWTTVYSGSYGSYDARDLSTWYTGITNKGTNNCYVNAKYLDATIRSIGNIYYRNDSIKSLNAQIFGSGEVLPF